MSEKNTQAEAERVAALETDQNRRNELQSKMDCLANMAETCRRDIECATVRGTQSAKNSVNDVVVLGKNVVESGFKTLAEIHEKLRAVLQTL